MSATGFGERAVQMISSNRRRISIAFCSAASGFACTVLARLAMRRPAMFRTFCGDQMVGMHAKGLLFGSRIMVEIDRSKR